MIELLQESWPLRVALGAAFFVGLGALDLYRHPEDPKRAKEYVFLFASMVLAVAYGIGHDHITATISPEYFLYGKELADDPRPFRLAVTILAVKASYGPGVLVGAFLLIANNPSKERPQLPYRELARYALVPLAAAALGALALGLTWKVDAWGQARFAREVADRGAERFLAVWRIHTGSYLGAGLGALVAVVLVHRRRNRRQGTGDRE